MNFAARNYYRDSRDPRRNYPVAAQDAHLRLLASLSNRIDPSVNRREYEAIIKKLVPYMVSVLSKNSKNFIDIFEALEKIHVIEIGKYGALKRVFTEFNPIYNQIIENGEEEIRLIMNPYNTQIHFPERRNQNSEDSFISTLSEEDSHQWIGKIPYQTKIKILTESDLENFSEAVNPLKLNVVRTAFWLSAEELDDIISSARGSMKYTCNLILLKWKEKNGGKATVKELIARFSDALEMDTFSINFVKARSSIESINLDLKTKK